MEAAGGADHQFDFFVDSIAVGEAFAHALQMEELADVEVWDLVPPPRAEGPAGSQAVTHHFPAGPPVFDDDVAGAAQANTNVHRHLVGGNIPLPRHAPTRPRGHQQGQDVDMHEEEEPSHSYQELQAAAADLQIFAAAQTQLNSFVVDRAARAIAANNNNQQAAPRPKPPPTSMPARQRQEAPTDPRSRSRKKEVPVTYCPLHSPGEEHPPVV